MRLCPKCGVSPSRHQVRGYRVAYCEACWAARTAAKYQATTARRKQERAQARAAVAPVCPSCLVNPPRYRQGLAGTVPLCEACFDARRRQKYCSIHARCYDDISAAEIEKRFQFAKQQIRRRNPWTSDSPS